MIDAHVLIVFLRLRKIEYIIPIYNQGSYTIIIDVNDSNLKCSNIIINMIVYDVF